MPRRASRRCVRRSNGATICSRPTSSACSPGSPCSPAAAPWKRPRPSAAPTWTCCSRSSTRASSATRSERFWMLETIREFALERLEETGGAEDLRRSVQRVLPRACGAREARAARPGAHRSGSTGSKRSTTTSAPSSATRSSTDAPTSHFGSAAQIWHFWWTRGYWSEGRRWLESALAAGRESDPQLRVEPLWGAGLLAVWQGDVERGSAVAEEMLALARRQIQSGRGPSHMAGLAAGARDDSIRRSSSTRSRRALRASRATRASHHCREQPRHDRAPTAGSTSARWSSSRRAWRSAGSGRIGPPRALRSLNLGITTLMLGDVQRARELLRDGLVAAREIGQVDVIHRGVRRLSGRRTHARIRHAPRACSAAPTRCARKRRSDLEEHSRALFATRRKQSCGRGWARTPTQRRTRRGARSRSRTRWRLPSAQIKKEAGSEGRRVVSVKSPLTSPRGHSRTLARRGGLVLALLRYLDGAVITGPFVPRLFQPDATTANKVGQARARVGS